ncbi:MAG: hypothetical protein D084_Lepto4C00431G0010 [Leptospirillum sp. Group IV 'UBA BS']|nr:MAG: hypothetical protein D084_Lepto4C00431G0010 [Leptospirillum sp. Group IV 'UBA BS']
MDKNIEPENDSMEILRKMLESSGVRPAKTEDEIEKESRELGEKMLAASSLDLEGHGTFPNEETVSNEPLNPLTFNERMTDWEKKVFGTASFGSIFLVFLFGFVMAWVFKPGPGKTVREIVQANVPNPGPFDGPGTLQPYSPFVITRIPFNRILLSTNEPYSHLEQCPSDKKMFCFQVKNDPGPIVSDILEHNNQNKGGSR